MPGATISAMVMTLNEERNIEYCLRSVRPWVDEVVVADMRSEDRTRELADRYADKVVSIERIEGFDAGRQKGFDAATSDWILSIDADEMVTRRLGAWIRDFVDGDPPYDLALIPRADIILGHWVRSAPWWPGKPRLFRREAIEVSGKLHHGLVPREGSRVATLPRDPRLSMWHFTILSMSSMLERTNRYTTIEARQAIEDGGDRPSPFELIYRPLRALAPYLLRRGYRDGLPGLAYAADRVYYDLLAALKRWDEPRVAHRQAEYDRMRERLLAPTGPRPGRPAALPADRGARATPTAPTAPTAAAESGSPPASTD